jgi:uncharacterized protein YbjT (DUF2867 family)
MHVAIAGAHGQIGRRLARILAGRGDAVTGLIRNPDQNEDLREDGTRPVVCDLESAAVEEIVAAIEGAEAVVFAAGAGPGSGGPRKLAMDRDGALKLVEAARAASVSRYVMVSAAGAGDPPSGDDVMSIYLRAKGEADAGLAASQLDWTIVRPGRLTDEAGTGSVRIETAPFRGEIPRDDVAAVLVAVLDESRSSRATLYVNTGEEPIAEALAAILNPV